MDFSISKRELLNALTISSRAISSSTPLPSLSGIKLVVSDDTLSMISSDSNISIKVVIKNEDDSSTLTVREEGEIIIDARYLLEMVRKISTEQVTFETIDGTLIKVWGGNSEYKINGMRAFEYPDINFEVNTETIFTLQSDFFADLIEQTAFACSDKDTRPVLTGVNLRAEGGRLYANATDSYRLASKTIDLNSDVSFNITVPAKYLNEVYHSIANEKEIEIGIDMQKISFRFGNATVQTRLLDDVFPDTSRLIPPAFSQILTIEAKKLLNVIDKCSFIKSDGKNTVKLTIDSDKLEVNSLNQAVSLHEETDIISFEGKPIEISCTGKYLEDAVKALRADTVRLCFSGELKPIVLKDPENDDITQLISPVRTYR